MSKDLLNQKRALIFRIVHLDNLPRVLDRGCHCRRTTQGQAYVGIGNPELIEKRESRPVPCGPGGTLSDYVPFYFTPCTPMLYNIKTGYNGIIKRPMEEIAILVSSIHFIGERNIRFVFSDRHAYLKTAQFSTDVVDLNWIIWDSLQERNFRKDDLERFEKYQAEALIYRHMPLDGLLGVACFNAQR